MERHIPESQPVFTDAQLLGAIVDTSEDAIVAKSSTGCIVSWNPAAERLFGYRADEAIGRHISIIIPPGREVEEETIMRRLLAGEGILRFETVRLRKDGQPVPVELSISPVKDAAGNLIGAVKVARDLRERLGAREALKREEERFRVLADNMSQLAWMADNRGTIFWYNKRWFEYTGTTPEQMQGWAWTTVHHPEHVDRVVARLQRSWDTGEPWEDEFPLRGKDGQFRWFLSRALPIRDPGGSIVRWFGTSTDITAQRQLAEELRSLSGELTLVNRRKDEFLAALSHEVRNPLGAIRTGLAVTKSGRLDAAAVSRTHAMMERQLAHLVQLLDDLLDVSRSTHGRLTLTVSDIDARAVIDDAVTAATPLLEAARVTLRVTLPDHPLPARADAARLEQILVNVLSNAARYTPAGGHAELAVTAEGTDLTAVVTDSGVGIPGDFLSQVFELFAQRQPDAAAASSGLGIGLYLTRELAIRHGGTISAASDGPGQGSRFTIRLPILELAPQATRPDDETPGADAGEGAPVPARRVLVVDDDQDNAEGLATLIALSGHQAQSAHDGPDALVKSRLFQPDVILLDIGLPGMDGFETCRQLRTLNGSHRPYIVAVTGWGQPSDYERTKAAGFDYHLVKPVEPRRLLTLLTSGHDEHSPEDGDRTSPHALSGLRLRSRDA